MPRAYSKIEEGTFREDLYYRLNVIPINIPPVRERLSDIPLLVQHLVHRFNQDYGRYVEKVGEEAVLELLNYHWPGNVRELENVLGRAIINMQTGETTIEARHLPVLQGSLRKGGSIESKENHYLPRVKYEGSFEELQRQWEKAVLLLSLQKAGGNKTKAAQDLKISIRNYYYKLQRHGLL